jgi:Uma2 family endonuclease
MTQSKTRFKTLEEYAALDTSDLPEVRYELVDGVIVEMGAESYQNLRIAVFLMSALLQFVPHYLLCIGAEIQVTSRSVTSRFPDLMVTTEDIHSMMQSKPRALITSTMPAPALIVEVVSPGGQGSDNYQRDYIDKRREYAARGIPEYWLIDPSRAVVMVMRLEDGGYMEKTFEGSDRVISSTFPTLELTAEHILNAGQPG